jgi:hypothetical protein
MMQKWGENFSGDDAMQESIDAIRVMPSVTPEEPRWIPISERLPNWDIQCLVTDGDGECGVGYYREDAHAWDSPNWGWLERKDRVDNKEAFTEPCGIGKVVAWMPLPAPYEPQESEVEDGNNNQHN